MLEAYLDVDFAGDLMDKNSWTWFVIHMNGGLILWGGWKQNEITSSTIEAKYSHQVWPLDKQFK
jgi:hypothetical protein